VQCSLPPRNIVGDEPTWRVPDLGSAVALSGSKVVATRWYSSKGRTQEFEAETPADSHVVKIVLRNTNIRFSVAGRIVQDGITTPGTVHVTGPCMPVRCLFRGPYDVLHLHVPNILITECARDMTGNAVPALCSNGNPRRDMTVEALSRALLDADRVGGSFGQIYAESIGLAIIARLLAAEDRRAERPKVSALALWRLKRAIDYFESQIGKPVRLAAVASSAGLSRMHFAAQFRAATGLSPHEYLLRRRIERAQEMLIDTRMSLVDIALTVGFQTQSHFTSVFKRYAGQSPRAWRESRESKFTR
jgi:AraC family transcriptional regulator